MATTTTNPRPVTNTVLLLKIRRNFKIIETTLKKSIGQQIINQKKDDKTKKTLKSKLLGNRLGKKLNLLGNIKQKIAAKGASIFDKIVNFFVMTFYGFIFTKLLPLLPKLVNIVKLLKPAGDIIGFITKGLLDVFSFFVSSGYAVKDKFSKQSENIKKEPVKNEFNSFNNALKNVLDNTINIAYSIVGEKPPNAEIPVKAANRGGIPAPTRGNVPVNAPPSRKIKNDPYNKIKTKQTQQETSIGRDVGGENKVRIFYGSPKPTTPSIFGIKLPQLVKSPEKTPVDVISNISKKLRSRRLLFGDIASVGSDIALGQKPNKLVYRNTAIDILQLVKFINDQKEQENKQDLIGMAYGGIIPPTARTAPRNLNMVNFVAGIIQRSVEKRVNESLSEIKMGIMAARSRKDSESTEEPNEEPKEGMGTAGGNYGGYSPKNGLEREIYNYLINEKQMNDNQALGLLANISRESGFNLAAIGDHGSSKGLFQWKDVRAEAMMRTIPDWKTNWKAQIDYALVEPRDLSLVEPGEYVGTNFNSPQEAADWWAKRWERPRDLVNANKKHGEYLGTVQKSPEGKVKFREGTEFSSSGSTGRLGPVELEQQVSTRDRGSGKYGRVASVNDIDNPQLQTGSNIELFGKRGLISKSFDPNSQQGPYGNRGVEISFPFELIYYDKIPPGFAFSGSPSVTDRGSTERMYKPDAARASFGNTGSYFYRDSRTKQIYQIFMGHGNKPFKKFKNGDVIPPGTVVGWQGATGTSNDTNGGLFDHITLHVNSSKGRYDAQKFLEVITGNLLRGEGAAIAERRRQQEAIAKKQDELSSKPEDQKPKGFNKGGYVGKQPYVPNGYTSYELPNTRIILAVQPRIIHQPVETNTSIVIPFPISTSVNSTGSYRA